VSYITLSLDNKCGKVEKRDKEFVATPFPKHTPD